ncbi:MAG TPA: outer membrane protein assembly factor BamD [Pyrinomonadaceae bacterium]|nr:outer membrane protein assembly factor BamD [Pyrinomonadaceae bacterium]
MRKLLLASCLVWFALGAQETARAQDRSQDRSKPAGQDIEAQALPDEMLAADAKKNLKAAQLYYTRKAYVGALQRCEETMAVYQRFNKFDEVLYIAGMSSARLARKEGKQPPALAPEKYLILARQYLTQLVNEHPKSGFRKRAEEELRTIGEPAPKADEKQ